MRADPDDQLDVEFERGQSPVFKWLLVIVVLVAIAAYWYWNDQQDQQKVAPVAPVAAVPVVQAEAPPAPDIPVRPEPVVVDDSASQESAEVESQPVVAPAPLADDDQLRHQLDIAGAGASLSGLVSTENSVEVSAALIDGMSRGVLMRKLLPIKAPTQAFEVVEEADVVYMSPKNYSRYDGYANAVSALDSELLVNGFHTLRPIYESAYEQLGLESADFDNAIIRSLDIILATPEIDGQIELERKSVMYSYADPSLEELPAVQKLLLRMGPDNVRRIKQKAQSIRAGLLAQ